MFVVMFSVTVIMKVVMLVRDVGSCLTVKVMVALFTDLGQGQEVDQGQAQEVDLAAEVGQGQEVAQGQAQRNQDLCQGRVQGRNLVQGQEVRVAKDQGLRVLQDLKGHGQEVQLGHTGQGQGVQQSQGHHLHPQHLVVTATEI